jgi:hypothetical protein
MPKILCLVPLLLPACAAGAPSGPPSSSDGGREGPIPIHGATPGHVCKAAGTAQFVGQPGNSETGAAILRTSNAAVLRWAPPGVMLTMDYRQDRATVYLDVDRKVTDVKCG